MVDPNPLTLDAYWLVLWEPRWKTLKGVGQIGCVFATEKEARQMLAAWPGGEVFEVVRAATLRDKEGHLLHAWRWLAGVHHADSTEYDSGELLIKRISKAETEIATATEWETEHPQGGRMWASEALAALQKEADTCPAERVRVGFRGLVDLEGRMIEVSPGDVVEKRGDQFFVNGRIVE